MRWLSSCICRRMGRRKPQEMFSSPSTMSSPSSCARDGHLDIRNTNCEDNTDRRVLFGPPKSESNPISLVFFFSAARGKLGACPGGFLPPGAAAANFALRSRCCTSSSVRAAHFWKKMGKMLSRDAEERGGTLQDVPGVVPPEPAGGKFGGSGRKQELLPRVRLADEPATLLADPNQLHMGQIWVFCCLQTSLVEDICCGFNQGFALCNHNQGDKLPATVPTINLAKRRKKTHQALVEFVTRLKNKEIFGAPKPLGHGGVTSYHRRVDQVGSLLQTLTLSSNKKSEPCSSCKRKIKK